MNDIRDAIYHLQRAKDQIWLSAEDQDSDRAAILEREINILIAELRVMMAEHFNEER